jgi:hypothetical protein
MNLEQVTLGLCVGVGLSAAAGFRIFVPLLLAGLSLKFQWFPSITSFVGTETWMSSTAAITCFFVATLLEVLAYKLPFLDNALDSISGPISLGAGALLTSEFLAPLDNQFLKYTLGIVAGAGSAGMVFGSTALARLVSSKATLGSANPLLALAELIAAAVTSLMAFLLPFVTIFAGVLFAAIVFFLWKKTRNRKLSFSQQPEQHSKSQ